MFGVTEEQLIQALEAIRRECCVYGAGPEETCDCKFGIGGEAGFSERTGCPELRQAIKVLQGRYEQIAVITQFGPAEQTAARTLREVADVLARAGVVV